MWSGAPIAASWPCRAPIAPWLQGLLTNDVASLAEGESRYAAYLTPQGRMITDMNVVSREGRLLLDVPATWPPACATRSTG